MPERLDRHSAEFRTRQLDKGALGLWLYAWPLQIVSSAAVSLFGLVWRPWDHPQIRFECSGSARALVVGRARALLRESAAEKTGRISAQF
jgi:hypothetical protein